MEWERKPSDDGYYWYIDVNYLDNLTLHLVRSEGMCITLEDCDYPVHELSYDNAWYLGPIEDIPTIPTEIIHEFERVKMPV